MGELGTYEVSHEIKGEILAVRKIQDRGRVQIPKFVRDELKIKTGDNVFWVRHINGQIYITKVVKFR